MKGCANAKTTRRCLHKEERPTEVELISQSYSKFEVTPSHWKGGFLSGNPLSLKFSSIKGGWLQVVNSEIKKQKGTNVN